MIDRDSFLMRFETAFAERLTSLADDAALRGVPRDLIARALLAAGLAFARRFDSGENIAAQLRPVLDEMADDGDVRSVPVQ
jgi:hypothetical protein